MKKSITVYVLMGETEYDADDICVWVQGVYDSVELARNEKYALEADCPKEMYWVEEHDVYTSN